MNALTCLYWFLVVTGGGFFLIAYIIGEAVEIGGDVADGISDTIGDALDGIFGGADAIDAVDVVDFDAADVDLDVDTDLSPFNLRTIAMFATGFGAGGLVGNGLGFSETLSLVTAFSSGIIVGAITWQILRFLYKEQATTSTQPIHYIGLMGRVSIPIAENGSGQVMIVVNMRQRNMAAKSESGEAIPTHTQVQVVSMEGGFITVKRVG